MNKQLNTLNCMRVLALIGVLGYHLVPEMILGGYLGVILFFQLSGFLLAYKSSEINTMKDVANFYSHKFKRIYGPLTIMIFATLGIISFLEINGLPVSIQELLSIFGGYNNQWQISQDLSYFARALNQSPYTHLWFIAIEIQCYLLWPVLIVIYKKMKEKAGNGATVVFWVMAVLSLLPMILLTKGTSDISNVYYSSFTRMGALLWGVVVGLLYKERKVLKKWKVCTIRFTTYILIAGLVGAYILLNSLWVETYTIGIPVITVATAFLLWMITTLGSAFLLETSDKKFITCLRTINKKISQFSYDIYLWMFPVIYVSNKMGVQTNPYTICGQMLVIIACAMCSFVTWKMFNKVSMELIKNFKFKNFTIKKATAALTSVIMFILILCGLVFATTLPMETDNSELQELLASMVEVENDEAEGLQDPSDDGEEVILDDETKKSDESNAQTEADEVTEESSETSEESDKDETDSQEDETKITVPDKIFIFAYYQSVEDKIVENAKLKEEYFIEKARLEAEAKAKAEAEAKAKAEAAAKAAAAAAKKTSTTSSNTSSGSTSVTAGNGIGVTSSRSVYFYGDSVMLGAAPSLKATFPNCSVSAVVSRRASTVAKSASATFGSIGKGTIVIALGTNGGVSQSDATTIVEAISSSKSIYFVTVKGVSSASTTNSNIRAVASKYSNVGIIDWNSYASGSSGWVYSDGYHLRPAGQKAYAQLMYNSLG